jgi:hypothetical protein
MKKSRIMLLVVGLLLALSSAAYAVPAVDVAEYPTGYFVDVDANKYNAPYYRWVGDDWGWTHNAVATPFTTATLSISAFDVDNEGVDSFWEKDLIEAYDTDSTSWLLLGELAGASDIWSYTTFVLPNSLFNEIVSGLQVRMIIDSTNSGWAVTLAKSVLSLDEGQIPDPEPGAVPEPSTFLLLGAGLAGLGYLRRRNTKG